MLTFDTQGDKSIYRAVNLDKDTAKRSFMFNVNGMVHG